MRPESAMTDPTPNHPRREHAAKYTHDGLPRDANSWTVEDWRLLHRMIRKVRREIGKRHGQKYHGETP